MTIRAFYHRVLTRYLRRLRPTPPPAPDPPVRRFARGPCPACGEIVPLRADGAPHARYHQCDALTRAIVEAAGIVLATPVPLCGRRRAPKPCACGEAGDAA